MAEIATQSSIAVPITEKLKGLSGFFGIRLGEQPEYYVVRSAGDKEIRKYDPMTLASVVMPVHGNFEKAREEAYRVLSRYIFGENELSYSLSMTTPIFEEYHYSNSEMLCPVIKQERAVALTMSIILPINYGMENAPSPLDTRIILHRKPSQKVACISYSGVSDPEKIQKYEKELRRWVGSFRTYRALEETQLAQYDGPATLAFLRKNELHIEVRPIG